MNAISCRTRITANRVVHFVATGSGLTIASLFFLAPAVSAAPLKICDLEQGPNGPQCVQEPKQAELCKLDKNLKCIQPQVELCELEQGPNGLQCVDNELDEKAPPPDPQPPVDPEPEPEAPEVDEVPEPEVAPGLEAAKPAGPEPVEIVAAEDTGVPDFEIAAGPAVEQPAARSYGGWIGLALLSSGLILLYARRRRQTQDDAASALQSM